MICSCDQTKQPHKVLSLFLIFFICEIQKKYHKSLCGHVYFKNDPSSLSNSNFTCSSRSNSRTKQDRTLVIYFYVFSTSRYVRKMQKKIFYMLTIFDHFLPHLAKPLKSSKTRQTNNYFRVLCIFN